MIKKICIISDHYPSGTDSTFAFVEQLVFALVDCGIEVTVISPFSKLSAKKNNRGFREEQEKRKTYNGNQYTVYSPRIFSFSNIPLIGNHVHEFRYSYMKHKIEKIIKFNNNQFDAIYGHFISNAGMLASEIGKRLNIPSFVACGESNIERSLQNIETSVVNKRLQNVKGVIAVSSEIKKQIEKLEIFNTDNIKVFSNGVDTKLFCPDKLDRERRRELLGVKQKDFVVAFIGHFTERKGPLRVLNAISQIPDVKGVFIGNGPQTPVGDNVLFNSQLNHKEIPGLLRIADVFVLPTLEEGCCNAVIEAMACGLPIISSDRKFNDDILFSDNSIRIDPNDIEQIKNAIVKLKENPIMKQELGECSFKHASILSIENRANVIAEFIESSILSL